MMTHRRHTTSRHERPLSRRWSAALVGALCVALLGSPAAAEIVDAGYTGTIDEIDAALAAALPPDSPIEIGAQIIVNYSYETTTPDTDPKQNAGIYSGAITSFTLYVGDQVFSHAPAGPKNEIDVLVDPLLNLYQPVDSVDAVPTLPIAVPLEADVIFIAANESPLVDDSLILPPTPDDPGWASAEAAITDDMHNTLINAVLDQKCTALCPVPNGNPPVPMSHPALVALAVAGAGAWSLRRRWIARPMPTG